MRYFTLDWWAEGCPVDAAERYWAYLTSVRDRLHPEVVRLIDEVSLHDSRLRTLEVIVAARRLEIGLDGFKYARDGTEKCRRRIVLSYPGLRRLHSSADPARGLAGPHGYGDLGYDEVELLADGCIEHRLLFSSGIELTIQSEQFRLAYHDAAGP
jgi:hypothetical protein